MAHFDKQEEKALGQKLRKTRKALGMTQADVADAIGIYRETYVLVEQGKRTLDIVEFRYICRLFGRSPNFLLELNPEDTPMGDRAKEILDAAESLYDRDFEMVLLFIDFLKMQNGLRARRGC